MVIILCIKISTQGQRGWQPGHPRHHPGSATDTVRWGRCYKARTAAKEFLTDWNIVLQWFDRVAHTIVQRVMLRRPGKQEQSFIEFLKMKLNEGCGSMR